MVRQLRTVYARRTLTPRAPSIRERINADRWRNAVVVRADSTFLKRIGNPFALSTGGSQGRNLIRGARHRCCPHANFRERSLKAFVRPRTREKLTAKTLHGCHTGIPKPPQ